MYLKILKNNLFIIIVSMISLFILLSIYYYYYHIEYFNNNDTFIEYYSLSTCPHCIEFNPLWETLDSPMSKKYVIDKDNVDDKLEKYDIEAFPTIIITKNGKKIDELDDRSCEALKEICKKHGIKNNLKCPKV
tara:strand:- start:3109 stop:3507 length:399 start_codon:yes stop_codon:yes gene_type:complete